MDPFESVISSIDRHYLSFESVMTGQPSKALNALFAGILPTPDPELSPLSAGAAWRAGAEIGAAPWPCVKCQVSSFKKSPMAMLVSKAR